VAKKTAKRPLDPCRLARLLKNWRSWRGSQGVA
jgi:hypothetical protein